MFEEHPKVSIPDFRGLYNRGNRKAVPLTHAILCQNATFEKNRVGVRNGWTRDVLGEYDWQASGVTLIEVFSYLSPTFGTAFYLISGSANLYNMSSGTPVSILNIPGWNGKFVATQVGDRVYIMPYSLSSTSLYVWKIGAAAARLACGTAPAGVPTAVAGGAGKIDRGTHLVAYAWETDTGYITKPSPVVAYVSPGADSISVGNITNGPAGTVAKHILMTKRISNYNGNTTGYEFFFVGKINDNVTVTFTIDKYDADLVDSADYLFDQLTSVPNARGLVYYGNRLVIYGFTEDRSLLRISRPNEPESFDAVDGNIILTPKVPGGVFACSEYHSILYIFTPTKTLATQDNLDIPSSWKVIITDPTIGIPYDFLEQDAPSRVVAEFKDVNTGGINDILIVGTNHGLRVFNGAYQDELTFNISNEISWFSIRKVLLDPTGKRIFVTYTNNTEEQFLMCDYKDGLNSEAVKWTTWIQDASLFRTNGIVPRVAKLTIEPLGAMYLWTAQWRYKYTAGKYRDGGTHSTGTTDAPVTWWYQLPHITFKPGWVNQFSGLILDLYYGGADYAVVHIHQSKINSFTLNAYTDMTVYPNDIEKEFRRLVNILNEQLSWGFKVLGDGPSPNQYIELSRVDIYGFPLWAHRPSTVLGS